MPPVEFGPGPVPGPRRVVLGRNGACATSHPLAVEAGHHMLRSGGTAADAAVAMAAALTVLEPTSNGIGSDAFALVWAEGELHGLNASGRAPFAASAAAAAAAGNVSVPVHGWDPVTVPGAPAAWHDLHARFGRLPFADVLAPSIAFAHEGHPVAPVVAAHWARAAKTHLAARGPEFAGWGPVFAPGGRAPAAGEVFRSPEHAATLRRLAETDVRDFYEGKTADAIAAFSRATGGRLTGDDLAAHVNDWVEPIGVSYRDAELWELPPNGQGIVALEALGILEGLPVPSSPLDEAGVHAAIEAVKLAFADALAWVTDLEHMAVDPGRFLEADYLDRRRAAIGERAERRETGFPRAGGTVYLAAADAGGMMVSYIQSNYMGFGSGIVVPGTGVALQNRGAGFSLDPGHPNVMAPGKRSYHTIIPAFLTRDGEPWGPLGVMGGHMQPQGHVQVMRAIVDHGLDPQAALDLPRWFFGEGLRVSFEDALPGTRAWPPETLGGLRDRGHDVDVVAEAGLFGRGQVILRSRSGVYAAGSDPRADGIALVY